MRGVVTHGIYVIIAFTVSARPAGGIGATVSGDNDGRADKRANGMTNIAYGSARL